MSEGKGWGGVGGWGLSESVFYFLDNNKSIYFSTSAEGGSEGKGRGGG